MRKVNKVELFIVKALRYILVISFMPVLFSTIFIGNNMDYNEGLKMTTLCPNWVLLFIALPVLIVTIFLIGWCNKHPLDKRGNIITTLILFILFIGVYFMSVRIAREIAFHLPWDIGVVTGTAIYNVAERIPIGYFYYLSIYTNNIPITYILGELFHYAKESAEYPFNPQFIWLQVNCILMSAGGFFSCLTIKRLTNNLMVTIITFLLNVLLIGLSPWKIAPYTDTYGLLFPIMGIYFYVCYKQAERTYTKIVYIILSVFCSTLGGLIKPNIMIVVIAIVLLEALSFIVNVKQQWRYFLIYTVTVICMMFAAGKCQDYIIDKIGLDFNPNIEAGLAEYFYMGLNEEKTGSYNSGDYAVYGEFQYTDRSEREQIVFGRALNRIKEKGFFGTIYFWLRKMVMTFNDGLFGWRTEVWIANHYSPVVSTNTEWMEFLREIYWNGPYVGAFNTIMQLVWIYCILGIPGLCFEKKKKEGSTILTLCFLGIFFYQVLFEARARYLFVFLPLIIVMATYGMYQYSLCIFAIFEKRMTKS